LYRASDWGAPFRRQSELKLNVLIRDINDNRPQVEDINSKFSGSEIIYNGSGSFHWKSGISDPDPVLDLDKMMLKVIAHFLFLKTQIIKNT